ncbi:MAG: hypothetical protein PVG39_22845 [Desulfobacteraceae bacterium]|jgi:hypothetical protein
MSWIRKINQYHQSQKEGFYRYLIPSPLYQAFDINPLNLLNKEGKKVVRFFCPEDQSTCLVEIKLPEIEDPVYSIQISDSIDQSSIEWDFLIINDLSSKRFNTDLDRHGKDTLFGWAERNMAEEEKAIKAGYCPGQIRKGLGLTRHTIDSLDLFCRILGIKSIRLEALFYHNAINFERFGFGYYEGYKAMLRIHELFQPGGELYHKMDNSNPFRLNESAYTVRGRSWAIHDNILNDINDDIIDGQWTSPVMYRMVENPRSMVTFPDPVY